eukprot:NODE_158_length_15065_cov_0.349125.p9 type:complete len:285 gc:universal NODE_158_length_15065_cov_0.349125:6838-5984(-)
MIFTTIFSAPVDNSYVPNVDNAYVPDVKNAYAPKVDNAYDPNAYADDPEANATEKKQVGWHIQTPPNTFKQVTSGGDLQCGITQDGCIYCLCKESKKWDLKTGYLKYISLDSDGKKVVGIDRDDHLVYADDINDAQWSKIDSNYKSVEISNSFIIAINSNNELYTAKFGSSDFKKQQGYMTSVAIYQNRACAVSTMGSQLVCTENVTDDAPSWKSIDTLKFKFTDIALSNVHLCGVSLKGVLICGDENGQNWYHTNGKMQNMALNGDTVTVVIKDGRMSTATLQ